jgi:hypothetical protein
MVHNWYVNGMWLPHHYGGGPAAALKQSPSKSSEKPGSDTKNCRLQWSSQLNCDAHDLLIIVLQAVCLFYCQQQNIHKNKFKKLITGEKNVLQDQISSREYLSCLVWRHPRGGY